MSEKPGDLSGMSGEQLQSTVQSIVSDPAFGRLLAQMQGKTDVPAESEPPQIPAITPEMMAKLPQMMSALAPIVGGSQSGGGEQSGGRSAPNDAERRKKLLAALKPYLSDHRREAVDGILKVTEMTELLGGLGHRHSDG